VTRRRWRRRRLGRSLMRLLDDTIVRSNRSFIGLTSGPEEVVDNYIKWKLINY
jgi:hypothetical protein